nr:hypothetical protein CFP56_43485 [Quercus suber]
MVQIRNRHGHTASFSRDCKNVVETSFTNDEKKEHVVVENKRLKTKGISNSNDGCASTSVLSEYSKFGVVVAELG